MRACDQALFDRIYVEYPWISKESLSQHIISTDMALSEEDRYLQVVRELECNGIFDVEDPSYAQNPASSEVISNDEWGSTNDGWETNSKVISNDGWDRSTTSEVISLNINAGRTSSQTAAVIATKRQLSSEPIKRRDVKFDHFRSPRKINCRIALIRDPSKYAYVLGLLLEADLPRVDEVFLTMLASRWLWMSRKELRQGIEEMKESRNYVVNPVDNLEARQWRSKGENMNSTFMKADMEQWWKRGLALRWNNTSRIMSHLYEFYSWTQLHREFSYIESAHIEKVLRENNYHYYPSFRKLFFQFYEQSWEIKGFIRSWARSVNDFPIPLQPHKEFYMEHAFVRRRNLFLMPGDLLAMCESCHECIALTNFKFERCQAFENFHVYCHFCLRKRVRRLRVKCQRRPRAIKCWLSNCTSSIKYDDSWGMAQDTFRQHVLDILVDYPMEYDDDTGPAQRQDAGALQRMSGLAMEGNKNRESCFERAEIQKINGDRELKLIGGSLAKVRITTGELGKIENRSVDTVEIDKERTEKKPAQSSTRNELIKKILTADNSNSSLQRKTKFEEEKGVVGKEEIVVSSEASLIPPLPTPLSKLKARKESLIGGVRKFLPKYRVIKKEVRGISSAPSSSTDEPPTSSHSSREYEKMASSTATLSSTDGTLSSSSPPSQVSFRSTERVDIDSTFRKVVAEQMKRVLENDSDWERPEVRWYEIVPPVKRRRGNNINTSTCTVSRGSSTCTVTSSSSWNAEEAKEEEEDWSSSSSADLQDYVKVV